MSDKIRRAAAAIANARGGRRGAPPLSNILDVLQSSPRLSKLYDEVMEDAHAAWAAAWLRPIAELPPELKDGRGLLLYGLHAEDNPRRREDMYKKGDHWWAIALWDVWRKPEEGGRWVFALNGAPLSMWGEPTHFCQLEPPG